MFKNIIDVYIVVIFKNIIDVYICIDTNDFI